MVNIATDFAVVCCAFIPRRRKNKIIYLFFTLAESLPWMAEDDFPTKKQRMNFR